MTTDTKPWAPAGTAGEHVPAQVITTGDQLLVHHNFGVWSLSHARDTARSSVWAPVIQRVRRRFTVRIDGQDWPVHVLNLGVLVVRRTVAQEILTLAASGRPDAVDLALECAFPSTPETNPLHPDYSMHRAMETIRDKVNGHLEAARARLDRETLSGPVQDRADAALSALEALAADLGL